VWRRRTIDEAGGWHADTLTEDLDLSFRAQLHGWTLAYVDALEAPSELPEAFAAVRTQQHRWMKGGAQVGRKLLSTVWSSSLPLGVRLQATSQLMGSSVFLAVVVLCLLAPLLVPLHTHSPGLVDVTIGPSTVVLNLALVVFTGLYLTTALRRARGLFAGLSRFIVDFPLFMSLSIGMCIHNAKAAIEGWRGHESAFVRTPKKGSSGGQGYVARPRDQLGPIRLGTAELLLGVHNLVGAAVAIWLGYRFGGAFLVLQGAGLTTVGTLALRRS
jgi:hypothetical protein